MIVPVEDVVAIVAGELDDCVLAEPLSVGTVVAIQTRVGERGRCYVEIVERWRHTSGGWVHRFALVAKPHSPRYLHRNPGAGLADYTTRTGSALREEGEAPSKDYMALFRQRSMAQALQDRSERRRVQQSLPLERRIESYIHEAKLRRIDVRKESRLLHQMLRAGRAHHAEQQARKIESKLDSDLGQAA